VTTTKIASAPIVWAGRLAMVLSFVSTGLLLAEDQDHLALPITLVAVVLAFMVIRRGGEKLASAHIGLNVGLLNIMLWGTMMVVM
jgi:hypothetical protein